MPLFQLSSCCFKAYLKLFILHQLARNPVTVAKINTNGPGEHLLGAVSYLNTKKMNSLPLLFLALLLLVADQKTNTVRHLQGLVWWMHRKDINL